MGKYTGNHILRVQLLSRDRWGLNATGSTAMVRVPGSTERYFFPVLIKQSYVFTVQDARTVITTLVSHARTTKDATRRSRVARISSSTETGTAATSRSSASTAASHASQCHSSKYTSVVPVARVTWPQVPDVVTSSSRNSLMAALWNCYSNCQRWKVYSAGLTMVQVVHLNRGLWTRGPHNFTEIIFIHTKYIKN